MKTLREHFPALKHTTYLDTAASGLIANPVMEWRGQQEKQLLHHPLDYRENTATILQATRQTIGKYLNASTEEVALLPNFSFGWNMLLEALPSNTKIAMLEEEYPSVSWPIYLRKFPTSLFSAQPDLETNILSCIESKKPDILLFSIVQWLDGMKIDLAFLHYLKEKYPKLLLIADGTQYIGTEFFDFQKSPIDILLVSAYKWLNAGFGSGFLLFKEKAQTSFMLKTIGFNSAESFKSSWQATRFIKHFEPGHLASVNFGSIHQSIRFLNNLNSDSCYQQIRLMSDKAKDAFLALDLLSDYIAKRKVHSSIFNLKGDSVLFHTLRQNNIACSLRGNGIRVSFHYYNNQEDLEKLLTILQGFF